MADKNEPTQLEVSINADDVKIKTDKKLLDKAEKLVRRLDGVVTELSELREKAHELAFGENTNHAENLNSKDYDRFVEMFTVIDGCVGILHQLDKRMARKYVGKEIDAVDSKRKTLKK